MTRRTISWHPSSPTLFLTPRTSSSTYIRTRRRAGCTKPFDGSSSSDMNELELIRLLTASLPANDSVITGAGDDCAVLDLGVPDRFVLFKTDAVVEGIHFTREAPPEKIGHKALARCLSDIAAMAGTPGSALVTLALPGEFDPKRIESIYAGMNA